ncbi:MAG TPA: DNA primase [Roseimicrobium sp.]|nr:DNA primase [Roseimicrobium sp.]
MADSSGNARGDRGDARGQVLAATDIVQLIGQTVSLKRAGRKFIGLCPFHQEKTPSFNVDPTKQYFMCFGCKASGTAFDFVMKRDRVEFVDALKTLAAAANIELPKYGGSKEKTGEKQALLEANSAACSLFENLLKDPRVGAPAREYLQKRGFNAEAIKAFQIGYVPEGWDNLARSPLMRKFPPGILALGGLVKNRTSGDGVYDTFRNRLMFPIRDENSRVIAFGGRVMPGSEDPAKYLNSPETPLFSKSRCVFGIDQARQRIVETRTVAVVEGYTDVVMAHQYGCTNVVSILGTAMTDQHLQILRRFADRIVLLFDADTAGDTAVDRSVELFLRENVEIAIASMPEGVDPDEYVMEHGPEGFNQLLANAADALTYKWKQLVRRFGESDDLTARTHAVEAYLATLASARGSGPVDSLRWGQALSRVSRLTDIPTEELNRRFRKEKTKPISRQPRYSQGDTDQGSETPIEATPTRTGPLNAEDRAERFILGILLNEPKRWQQVQQHVQPAHFTDRIRQMLAERYWDHQRNEGEPVFSEFLSLLDSEPLKQLALEVADEVEELADVEKLLNDSIGHFEEVRKGHATDRLVAESKKDVDELEYFRRLSDHKKQPDLRKVL